ncbi:DEAD/DEAH box helicase [Brevibacterium aurantiacum]|uniref:DEAD/DEAH box helicase n=1 Tax=Brevibacterium aurantiacum TaxID=273384 RepID=UPI001866FE2B|nr:type ISP restriction/modification enzyme [Brevibacterium aurantiacum]
MTTSAHEDAFGRLLDALYFGALDERDKGDKFERLMRSYLMTDPAWASQFSHVWLWSDYPGRNGRPDTGIDLVAEEATGDRVAIQCKFYDPDHVVGKKDIDSFIAASSTQEFSRRLLVSTSLKEWGANAEAQIQDLNPPLTRIGLADLAEAPIDWSQFSLETPDHMVRTDAKKSPRAHQREALAAVADGFAHADRGKLVMACGTGKTYTALQVVENQTPADATVLFLVPSISLLSQTLTEWKRDATEDFQAFAVCSDVKVGKNTDADMSTTDLLIPATTDANKLVAQAKRGKGFAGRTIVFSTYQSIDVLHQAQEFGFGDFDLVICDEAHRTTGATLAGAEESAFVKVHDDAFLTAAKRLYMTATPRIFDEVSRKKADENSVAVASMDDEALFGPEFYRLGFGEAVHRGLLTDYKVLVLAVDEAAINQQFQSLLVDEDGELSIDDVARIVGCWKGLASRGADRDAQADSVMPMRRAVAFAANIKESQKTADMFDRVSHTLAERNPASLTCRAEHVDGGMNVAIRNRKLRWLEEIPEPDECRILTNARCLSEGVDVPDLDAVMFLNPRNSQVDVVQSVGRVMRRAEGKDYGYIILPVGIPAGQEPEQALKDNKKYKVIWSVLNALRSHDDRFEAMVNKIDLNQDRDTRLEVLPTTVGEDGTVIIPDDDGQGVLDLEFPGLEQWRDAIYARIVKKVGEREYWENWSSTIADIATRHTERITALVTDTTDPTVTGAFEDFVTALRANLNDGITESDAISMLSQHVITKPVFDALFAGYDFAARNPVSRVMETMLTTLEGNNLAAETSSLDGFYASVARRAAGIDNPEGKQRVITELYEHFFKKAFPKQADALGVVYTPVEIVDFIVRSVNDLSIEHFGAGISDAGVHVLDPFTGTGTFIVRLLESGIISPHDLARKYAEELHANEIMLLAYYIAAINIEATYHGLAGGDYAPFEGIVLTDTFQMSEDADTLDTTLFTGNNDRVTRQLDTDITVIVGNPPYSAGQTSGNDNNANQSYPALDSSIRDTYAARSDSQLKNSLYDSYIRALRWGTDRIGDKGILAYVTNGGYIDSNSADGIRTTLTNDFDHLYIYNLRGNQRTAGELSRKEGGKVFGGGSRATVAIMIGVKDPTHTGDCVLHYRDIGDYLSREDKLATLESSELITMGWDTITPNKKGEWINQSADQFDTYPPIGDKSKGRASAPIFTTYSAGLKTNRDAWCYNSSANEVSTNIIRSIDFYNSEVGRIAAIGGANGLEKKVEDLIAYDSSQFKWDRINRKDVARGTKLSYDGHALRTAVYRPFFKQNVYFDSTQRLNNCTYQLPSMFPTPNQPNHGYFLVSPGESAGFSALATDVIPDLHLIATGQFFSRYTYEPVLSDDQLEVSSADDIIIEGYRRVDNIRDDALHRYQATFGDGVSKDDIFASTYALLHSPQYRNTFAADLKRQLPRIPLPPNFEAFEEFVAAGKTLLDLHINYETVDPYPLHEQHSTADSNSADFYRVQKLKYGGSARNKDLSTIVYNANVTLSGIPDEAHEYVLGSRTALDWILDRYQVKTDKASGIVNDPNDWGLEHDDPRYIVDLIKRITTISVETMKIVKNLPALELD